MRTTVDIDEDLLRTVRAIAHENEQSIGRTLTDLARKGLEPPAANFATVNGIPVLMPKPGAKPVTSEHVKELLELED
jgi:hypothetical protein